MKRLLFLLTLIGCGSEVSFNDGSPINYKPQSEIQWKSVATAEIHIGAQEGLSLVENITYVATTINKVNINVATLINTPTDNSEVDGVLDLGSLSVNTLKINNLNQCGAGAAPCSVARIIVYTIDVASDPGIAGFVNTSGAYGIPVLTGDNTVTTVAGGTIVGFTDANAAEVDIYTILGTDNRIDQNDFTIGPYPILIDMSNAGIGIFEMNLVIDIQLGN